MVIGLGVLGPAAEYRAKSRVVLSVPELLLVKISSAIMVALSLMLVSISIFGLYTLSSHYLVSTDWEVSYVKIYQMPS